MYKVIFYKSDRDRLDDVKSVKEFHSFEKARDFFYMRSTSRMGAVNLIHPN